MANETNETPLVEKKFRLDIGTLETRAAHLPESMRDNLIWLGRFLDEECARDLDLLVAAFKEVEITHDKTTWSKILRGMWNRDASGHETPAPVISEVKFNSAVNSLRNANKIKEQGGGIPFIKTPTADLIWNYLEILRSPDRVNKFGVIIGETGSQKSATLKEYCRQNNHGLCVRVESPETPSMNQFMNDLARAYGYSTQPSYHRKKAYILEKVNRKKTIIVENIQQLYIDKLGANQPIFDFLKKLNEDTGCTIVMTFTPVFEQKFIESTHKGFFEQFVGRAGGTRKFLRLPEYPPEEDCVAIAKGFGLREAGKHGAYLAKIAREPGRIRRLIEDLQDAKIDAAADEKPLTIEYVKATRDED